jgi:hypothetical protein
LPFVEAELETQHVDRARYTMETMTKAQAADVEVLNVSSDGERNQVSVSVDGKPFAKTSHQDVPISLEVHIDEVKYRIICVRMDL